MEQLIDLGVTIFLSYLVLTSAVKEHRYTEHGESDSRHFTNGHINKTIQVCIKKITSIGNLKNTAGG